MKTKFITLAVAVMMIVMATTVTAFAATGTWKQDEQTQVWTCLDKEGNKITEDWVKSGDDWFWLDEDGNMATAKLVDYNGYLYHVDETGRMIKNNWVHVDNEDYENRWMYFQSTGRAYKEGWKKVNGKEYHFTDNCMDYGFLDSNAAMIDKDADDAWKEATYYCGEDGAKRVNEWLKVDDMEAADGQNWIYFAANGKKLVDCTKTINGKSYVFGTDGAMKVEFITASNSITIASDSNISKFADANGALVKKGWVWARLNENDENENWFYANGNGQLAKSCVKTINGKKYAFDENGKMLTGFVGVADNAPITEAVSAEDVVKADMYTTGCDYMYFTESATPSEQGAAVLNKSAITVSDAEVVINFNSRGVAHADGEQVRNNYFYINSVLYSFEESDYKYEPRVINGVQYVITLKTGRASKNGTFTDSDNNLKYVLKEGVLTEYVKDVNGKWVVK